MDLEKATQITFGNGLVRMSKARMEGDSFESILIFSENAEPKPIGEVDTNCPYAGKEASAIPGKRVELWFDNIQGLDALIASLQEIRQQMPNSIIREESTKTGSGE